MRPHIRFLSRGQIDDARWDECVDASPQGLIYALSWYLDIVAPQWTGLVQGDYEAVFPLPINRKLLGIPQVYAPFLCQQLGSFARIPHPADTFRFLETAREKWFWRFRLPLHEQTAAADIGPPWKVLPAPNFVLPLTADHAQTAAGYSENHRRNIRKAERSGLAFAEGKNIGEFVRNIRSYQQNKGNRIPDSLYPMAEKLAYALLERGSGQFTTALSPEGVAQAAIFWAHWKKRWTNLLNLTLPGGQQNGAMHALVDHLVRERSASGDILDFEGSSLPNLARFYRGFGAVQRPYYFVSRG